jgi:hypothetical protein
MSDIDPIQYGQLIAKVDLLEKQVGDMQADVKQLLALANRSKGGLWFGMAVVSGLSSVAGWVLSHWSQQ